MNIKRQKINKRLKSRSKVGKMRGRRPRGNRTVTTDGAGTVIIRYYSEPDNPAVQLCKSQGTRVLERNQKLRRELRELDSIWDWYDYIEKLRNRRIAGCSVSADIFLCIRLLWNMQVLYNSSCSLKDYEISKLLNGYGILTDCKNPPSAFAIHNCKKNRYREILCIKMNRREHFHEGFLYLLSGNEIFSEQDAVTLSLLASRFVQLFNHLENKKTREQIRQQEFIEEEFSWTRVWFLRRIEYDTDN